MSSTSDMTDDVASPLLSALIADPAVTSVGRLAMRDSGRVFEDPVGPRAASVDASWSLDLDGEWAFRLVDRPGAVGRDMLVGDLDATWDRILVPGAWTLQTPGTTSLGGHAPGRLGDGRHAFEAPHYTNVVMPFDADPPDVLEQNPTGVYRRTVSVPRAWARRRTVLRIGAAESVVQVFVDGRFVGGGTDSRLPSEFDLTAFVRAGRRCELAVVVTKWSAQTWLEDQDQWWHGGLQRSVSLYSTPSSHLARVKVLPGLAADRTTGTVELEAVLEGPATREPGWTVAVDIETLGARRVGGCDPIEVPIWDPSSEVAQLLGAMFVEPGTVRAGIEVPRIGAWSHERPQRYRILTVLRDPSGDIVQVHSALIGFRSVEISGNELLINGASVLLHGVNLHEHDPDRGRAVGVDLTRRDLELMKAHNLNAVRAAHYPHDEHLAELCDELGLYLVDEANVESHGRQASLCHDPRYSHSIIERVQRMAERDQHHPSIIMWSLGNESGYGAPHDAAAAWLRRYDPTRPLHYEGPLMHDLYAAAPVTDVVCPMYSSIDEILAWAASGRDPRRPLILCEYSHAMGNSNGSLADYWSAIESAHGLQGGFIWEWLEHGLRRTDATGRVLRGPGGGVSWGYGGDFGDSPNDSNFICDGLVSADRVPHPAMAEVHHIGRPVRVEWNAGSASAPKLRIANHRWFTGLDDLRARWTLTADGEPIVSGELDLPTVAPRRSALVRVPYRAAAVEAADPGAELHLTVTWSQRRRTAWAPAGHVVGRDQLTLPARDAVARSATRPLSAGVPAAHGVTAGVTATAAVDDVAELAWRPTIFRALTDNDGLRQGWMRGLFGELRRWVDDQGLDRSEWSPGMQRRRRDGGDLVLTSSGELTPACGGPSVTVRRRVRVRPDGWSHLWVELRLPRELSDPPRLGIELELPATPDGRAWEQLHWLGDGPHECYPDRRAASTVGRWSTTVSDTYVDYVVPQEHGHRTGLRWLALTRGTGRERAGLLVVAEPLAAAKGGTARRPGFAARHHSDAELWAATHTDQLSDGPGRATYLYLDAAQRGLGTGSCGPDALGAYRIPAGRHTISAWFRAFDPNVEDPSALAAVVRGSDGG